MNSTFSFSVSDNVSIQFLTPTLLYDRWKIFIPFWNIRLLLLAIRFIDENTENDLSMKARIILFSRRNMRIWKYTKQSIVRNVRLRCNMLWNKCQRPLTFYEHIISVQRNRMYPILLQSIPVVPDFNFNKRMSERNHMDGREPFGYFFFSLNNETGLWQTLCIEFKLSKVRMWSTDGIVFDSTESFGSLSCDNVNCLSANVFIDWE